MKRYFIKYYSNFSNVYDIVSVESDADKMQLALHQDDWEQITLRKVREKIRLEKFRRKYESYSSGYAPIEVLSMSDFYQDETTQLPEKKVKNKLVIQHKEKDNVRTRGGLSR